MTIMTTMTRLFALFLIFTANVAAAQGLTPVTPATSPSTTQPATTPSGDKYINQYDEKYKVKPIIVQTGKTSVIPENQIGVYFVRTDEAHPHEATLRLASPLSINGCISADQPPPTVELQPPYMRVFLEKPSIKIDREPQQNRLMCREPPRFLYSDVILNRDELIAQGIKKIALRTDMVTDNYNIDLDSEHIMLIPESQNVFKAQNTPGKSNPLEYWFYPANTIVLSVPKSKDGAETYELLKPLANQKNLITLGSVLPSFGQNLEGETRFYFVDETGAIPREMGEKNSMPFGEIEISRTLTGMKGPYQVNEKLPVFAMKPGYYD